MSFRHFFPLLKIKKSICGERLKEVELIALTSPNL